MKKKAYIADPEVLDAFKKGEATGRRLLKKYGNDGLATVIGGIKHAILKDLDKREQTQAVKNAIIQLR